MTAPTRRAFLGATAGSLLAAGALARSAHRASGRKLALKIGMIAPGTSLSEKFAVAARCGFDGVELDGPGVVTLEEVQRAKRESGLEVPGVVDALHWRDTLVDADEAVRARGREALGGALREAQAFGASSVLLVPGVVNEHLAYDDVWRRSQEEIAKVLPLAEELAVDILIENVWNGFLLSPLEAARYVDEFASPRIGWHFDVGNVVNFGWPAQWIRILGRRIRKLDIKEFSRSKRDAEGLWKGFAVEIGAGDCDWPAVRAALGEIGYEGWACAEVAGGDEARLAEIRTKMAGVLGREG